MIKVTALRVGNGVSRLSEGGVLIPAEVKSISIEGKVCLGYPDVGAFDHVFSEEDLFPILIDEPWLKAFRFRCVEPQLSKAFWNHPKWSKHFCLYSEMLDETVPTYLLAFREDEKPSIPISSHFHTPYVSGYFTGLHQLQNLYFALTGEELSMRKQ